MINEIDILHESHSCDFTSHTSKKAAGLLCVVSYHHEIVVELGEYSFDSFAELLVGPGRRTPVFLIQPIRDFKRDVGYLKEILLNLGSEVPLVSKHHAIIIFPAHIIKIMEVMDACGCHVIRMYDATYPADGMELIPIVVYALRCAISPVGSRIDIVTSYDTAFRPCVLADLYRLGINTEILLALMVQAMKKEILAVETESLGCYTQSHNFEVGKLRDNATTRYVPEFIYTIPGEILADTEDSDEICYEVAHKQTNSS